ncbi:MAG: GerMN domain-containing protein [Oscillospiraceae bacterium]|nr:GerMN domain-containing protein [Oscillospiraceae bacterium]
MLKTAKRALAPALALCLLLSGCLLRSSDAAGCVAGVYRVNTGSAGLLVLEPLGGLDTTEEILAALNSAPEQSGMERAFPDGVEALSVEVTGGVRAAVEMSESYAECSESDRLVAALACAMTLCLMDNIAAVDIYCGGELCCEGLNLSSALLDDVTCGGADVPIKLWLPNESGGVTPRTEYIALDAETAAAEAVVQRLLTALISADGGGYALPEDTALLGVETADGLCTVNLSREMFATEPESTEDAQAVIHSFVATFCSLAGVDAVTIQSDGRDIYSYGRYITHWPMTFTL